MESERLARQFVAQFATFRGRTLLCARKTRLCERKILDRPLPAAVLDGDVDMTPHQREIVRTELLRSIVWFGVGIVGWPLVTTELSWLDATPLTVFGLPVVTWAVLTASAVGIRSVTGSDLRVRTTSGISLSLALGIMLGGVTAVSLATVGGYPAGWVTLGYVAVTAVTSLWYWYVHPTGRGSTATI